MQAAPFFSNLRADFPALQQEIYGKPFIYLDSAATTLKPQCVIDAVDEYYSKQSANIHRGVYYTSVQATELYEQSRIAAQKLLNAVSSQEIIFVRGTTEAINLVASSFGRKFLKSGDVILLSTIEHHSNIVPWQLLCEQLGAQIRVIPVNDHGEIVLDEYQKLLDEKVRLVSVAHISNAIGTIHPIKKMIEMAHRTGAVVLIDGAQAAGHTPVDVQELDCDFYALSGHKLYGPTGVGVLYGKSDLLNQMPPYQGGGEMIRSVTFEKTTYHDLPYKFEAGTPSIASCIGLREAIEYVKRIGLLKISDREKQLLKYASDKINEVEGVRVIGTATQKAGILSFVLKGIHAHDIGTVLDQEGIAIRAGHHCAMPTMQRFGVPATARASFALYNTEEEIDSLVNSLNKVKKLFA